MVKFKDTDFLHAGARIKVLENKMLTERQLVQMIESHSLEEAYKIANDAGIGVGVPLAEYERALEENLQETYSFLAALAGEGAGILDLLRYEYDALNLKILIKAQALNKEPDALVSLGNVPPEQLREQFVDGEFSEALHPLMAEAAATATDLLARTKDPQAVDIVIDQAMLAAMLQKVREYDNKFLHKVVISKIDIANLRSMVRVARMERDHEFFKNVVVPGGSLNVDAMVDAYLKGSDGIAAFIEDSAYGHYLDSAIGAVRANGSLTEFEKLCDNYTVRQLEQIRLVPFGIELIVAHAIAKEAEIKAVRVVLASRMAGVKPELIKERLRETYA